MQTMQKLTRQTLATLASRPTRPNREDSLTSTFAPSVIHPARTAWQNKWLALDCHHERIQDLADEAESFCGRWFRNNPEKSLLVLAGESGCGKSHVARKIF